jgi:serine/threonine-protein kinase
MAEKAIPKVLEALMKRAPAKRPEGPLGNVGRYELLDLVGRGGHGKVYRARDRETGKIVAIKILHDAVKNEELEFRMKREAYAMGRLHGTCATEVDECATTDTGQLYLAMEFLDGQGLDTFIKERERSGHRLRLREVLEFLAPVIYTLGVAHARGIIHRDLKPENIFVRRDGSVRLVDFGLMKDLNLAQLTAAGMVAGSPGYIAPETWAGASERLDHRIDVYALGVIVFRCLAGKKPFEMDGSILDFILIVTKAPRPSLRALAPELPRGIDAWVERALAIDPEARFESVAALWEELLAVAEA